MIGAAKADIMVNDNAGATGTTFFTQSETSMIVFGSTVVVGYNDSGSNNGASKFTGWARSTDGGATFTDLGTLPTNPGGDAGDPFLARNSSTGRIYFSTLSFGGGDRMDPTVFFDKILVPEPMTLALFGLGLAGIGLARRRKTA